jgi:hypothetical protein
MKLGKCIERNQEKKKLASVEKDRGILIVRLAGAVPLISLDTN